MSDLEKAQKACVAKREWLTSIVNDIDELIALGPRRCTVIVLEAAIEVYNKRLSEYEIAQLLVEEHTEAGDLGADIAESADYLRNVHKHKVAACELLAQISQSNPPSGNGSTSGDSHSQGSLSPDAVKLPKLVLPEFGGKVTEWTRFWESFEASVDKSTLPDVSKLTYLLSLLKDEAKRSVEGLPLRGDSYKVAVDVLLERFGRKEAIIFEHIQELMSLNLQGYEGKVPTKTLRRIEEEVLIHVRSLENLGVRRDLYGVVLTPVILSSLSKDIILEWRRNGKGKEADLTFLLDFLKEEVERREMTDTLKAFSSKTPSSGKHPANQEKKKQTKFKGKSPGTPVHVASAAALSVNSKETSTCTCVFCNKSHPSEKCSNVYNLSHQQRMDIFMSNRLCFACLKPTSRGHISKTCKERCPICRGKHHLVLCERVHNTESNSTFTPQCSRAKDSNSHTTEGASQEVHNIVFAKTESRASLYQTAKVLVRGSKGQVQATVLLDCGSDRTYIKQGLAQKVGAKWIGSRQFTYAPFGGGKSTKHRNLHEIDLCSILCKNESVRVQAISVQEITVPIVRQELPRSMESKIRHLKFADNIFDPGSIDVDILVGLDHYWSIVGQDSIKLDDQLVAQDTLFGYVVSGSYRTETECDIHVTSISHTLFTLTSNSDMPDCRQFWELDAIGIGPSDKGRTEQHPTLEKFLSSVKFDQGRYSVNLPWKADKRSQLIDNYDVAKSRLNGLLRRLDKNPSLKEAYSRTLQDMKERAFIEEVHSRESPYPVQYLPHRPVVKEASTSTKIRPVFDASCKASNGLSLNDCLEVGPCLLPNLVEVLLRFRRWRFALSADITKAFLQIGLSEKDRDVHRFLWVVDNQVRMFRFVRVTFGVNCSPFLLNASIKHHLGLYTESTVVQELKENLYVDDWLSGADREEEVQSLYQSAQSIMADAGMTLAKWNSNSKTFQDEIVSEGNDYMKVLGVQWVSTDDVFCFQTLSLPDGIVATKRLLLSVIARIYDPLGFLSPYVMSAKIMFQQVWKLGLDWDDLLPSDLEQNFQTWFNGLKILKSWYVPRKFFEKGWSGVETDLEIHGFGDASELGYGSVVYVKYGSEVALVMSKARIAPVKKVTLPRLELLASLLTARLISFVKKALKLKDATRTFCWSDSQVALAWIKGDPSRWKQFVANRVTEIQSLTAPSQWRYCPTGDNPADLMTRGMSAERFLQSQMWLFGPSWLPGPEDEFPCVGVPKQEVEESESHCGPVLVSGSVSDQVKILPCERWSSFTKSIRVLGWVMRFVSNCKSEKVRGDLTYEEMSKAKSLLYKVVQVEVFGGELSRLEQKQSVHKNSPLFKLSPFLDDKGLVRSGTRLQLSDLSIEEKHPIILPKGHLALLIVRHQHLLLKHGGVDTLVSSLRDSLWIIGVRGIAKSVVKHCISCQRQEARSCNAPAAPLPLDRVKQSCPFTVTGVDFAGPLFSVDAPKQKLYICLFTCGVVRAVHLELTDSMSVPAFMLAFRRFVARRGLPSVIYSDNALTFVSFKDQFPELYGPNAPQWKFIVPRSPWWGGFWERMVGSVKSSLRKTLGRRALTRIELETTLVEVEACVNSRPLTFVSDDIKCVQPLSPAHFLLNRRYLYQPDVAELPVVDREHLLERERLRIELLDQFWEVWRQSYLRNLPAVVHKFHQKGDLCIGSIVLIREDNIPRLRWDMGIVEKLYRSHDGIVRSAQVRISKGVRTRPIHRLHSMELTHESDSNVLLPSDDNISVTEPISDVNDNSDQHDQDSVATRSGRIVKPVNRLDL
jgi:hypothetical protein